MKLAKLVIAMVLCNLFALGQVVNNKGTKEQDTFTATVSGTPVILYDSIGTQTNSFEIVPTGGPATVSVVVVGCMRSGTCSATLTSTTSTSSSLLSTTSGPYDYYQITPSWTGGSSPTIKINRTGTAARSNNGGVAASVPFSGITSGINTSAQMQVGGTAALSPLNLGQVAGDQTWLQPGLSAPTITSTLSGGSLGSGQALLWQYTLNTSLGETLPSILVGGFGTSPACNSGASCTATMVAPTIPSGYTGYTVYWCDVSAGVGCSLPVKVLACVNISTNCTVTAPISSGVALPTINTAIIQPPNVQATNGPAGFIPSVFFPKTDGNYYPWLGVEWNSCDATSGPPLPCGTPMFTHRTYFNDQQTATVAGKNAFVVIDHSTGVGTNQITNQDRALWINITNPTGDTTQHYSIASLQAETDVLGNPTWTGQPDAEAVTGSFQLSDQTTGVGVLGPNGGVHAIRADYFKSGAGSFSSGTNYVAVQGKFIINNSAFSAGDQAPAFSAHCVNNVGGTINNLFCMGMKWNPPSGTITNGTAALYEAGGGPTGTNDWLIRNDTAVKSLMGGTLIFSGINNSASAAMTVNAAENIQSSLTVTQGAITAPSSASCTGGASTYSYQLVGVDNNGGTVTSTSASCVTGVNPLTGVNPASIILTNNSTTQAQWASFVRIDVYRTAGPMATGKIGSLTCAQAAGAVGPSCSTFSDTGLAATTAVPTVNTTGGATIGGDLTLGTSKGQHLNTQAANNDHAGTCTAAAATTCTVTFTRAYTAAPVCVATDATNITTLKVTPSTASLIITTTGATSDVFDYVCTGNPN